MSSMNLSSMSTSIARDPYETVLEIAEKIINSLNDKKIVSRYFEQKKRIMSASPQSFSSSSSLDTARAYQSYQKFVEENSAGTQGGTGL